MALSAIIFNLGTILIAITVTIAQVGDNSMSELLLLFLIVGILLLAIGVVLAICEYRAHKREQRELRDKLEEINHKLG